VTQTDAEGKREKKAYFDPGARNPFRKRCICT